MACADGETKLLPTGSSAPSDHPEVSCHASSSSKPRVKPKEVKEVPQPFLKSCVSWPVYPQFPSIRFVVGCFIPSLFHYFFYLCSGQVNVFLFYTLVYMFVLICTCVCVCVFACLHLDHFLCFQIQAYPARLRGPTNSKCFLSILTKLENLRAIDLSEIPTKR